MTWNHRVMLKDGFYSIHEVYYDEGGEIVAWTENPVWPQGETLEELDQEIQHFMDARRKPVVER